MKQSRLSTIFSSSKKRDENLLPLSQKKILGKVSDVNMHDASSIKDVMKKGYETMQMKLITPTKNSTANSRRSPIKDSSSESVNRVFQESKEVNQMKTQEDERNSNQNFLLKSVKVQDSNNQNSHKLISSRVNLKRVKGFDDREDSGERTVELRPSHVSFGAKHTSTADHKDSLENVAAKFEDKNTEKQVTFASETSTIVSNKKRSLKRVSKNDVEASINSLSYSTINLVKQLRKAKESDKENLTSNEHNLKSLCDQSKASEESKIVKETQSTSNQDGFKSPLKSVVSIADLSKKHLDIIRKARQRKQTKNDLWICEQNKSENELKVDKLLDAPSISEKYSELIAEGELELVLPSHFKYMIQCLRSIDQVMLFYRNRSKI